MNCQIFESIVNDLACDRIMEATVREQASLHSASCETCAVRLRDEYNLTKQLSDLSAWMQQDTAPATVEARLVSEFHKYRDAKHVVNGRVNPQPAVAGAGRYRRHYRAYAAAAAAVVLVVLGLTAIRFARPALWTKSVQTAAVAKNEDSALPAKPGVESVKANEENSTDLVVPRNQKRFAKRSAASRFRAPKNTVTVVSLKIVPPNYDEVTTEFIPIAYSNASNVQEGGQVMRLELPRYAMARFGIPVNVDRYDERVKADVWVGTDGLARAIRFVQ